MRPASSGEVLSAVVAKVLAPEMLQEVLAGKSQKYLDVSGDGALPPEEGGIAGASPSVAHEQEQDEAEASRRSEGPEPSPVAASEEIIASSASAQEMQEVTPQVLAQLLEILLPV